MDGIDAMSDPRRMMEALTIGPRGRSPMVHTRPYFDAAEFAELLHSAMHRAGCESPDAAAAFVTGMTGYPVEPSEIADVLSGDHMKPPVSAPLLVALIETFEPPGGFPYFSTAFRPESMAHIQKLRKEREVDGIPV